MTTTTTSLRDDRIVIVRKMVARHANKRGMKPELARAVMLVTPFVHWIQVGDEDVDRKLRLDWEAGLAYGGYHGYDYERITEEADFVSSFYQQDISDLLKQ